MTVAEQLVAEKLGMDPTDIALRNVHGPLSQTDSGIPPSLQMCIDKGKKAMNWKWHPAGTKKLPDGRMHGLSFRYNQSPRHAMQRDPLERVVSPCGHCEQSETIHPRDREMDWIRIRLNSVPL